MGGWWRRWLQRSAHARKGRDRAHALYLALVGLARQPFYYTQGGVPDTNDGRLEMVGLHVALAMRRLGRDAGAGKAASQALVDLMFADIDRNLRELGVGDLSVGKKVQAIAASFRGRTAALEAALAAADREAVATMLLRNLYLSGPMPEPGQVMAVADRLLALDAALARSDIASLLAGGPPLDMAERSERGSAVDPVSPHF